ncbi:MAG: cation transporter [Hyphomicrobiales bacterium]
MKNHKELSISKHEQQLFKYALLLSWFTIIYNFIEGIVSIFFGIEDETLTLFGFGADSFIETISAFGILIMIYRIRMNPCSKRGQKEISALRLTGYAFYVLCVILFISAVINVINNSQPTTTFWGIIISTISILSMIFLVYFKKRIGKKLNSQPILADANCNLVCVYMSVVLLVSSVLYELFGIPYIDILGTLGVIYFSFKEGRESLAKAKGKECCCH